MGWLTKILDLLGSQGVIAQLLGIVGSIIGMFKKKPVEVEQEIIEDNRSDLEHAQQTGRPKK